MSVKSDVFYLSFVHCFPFLHFANYPVYKFNISLFKKKKILAILNSYFNSDNQMRKIRDEQLYPVWGIFVRFTRINFNNAFAFCTFILHISLLYSYVPLCVRRINKLVFIYIT